MALPALSAEAPTRDITDRANKMIREYNLMHTSQTVANLPTQVYFGMRTFVTDANATTFRSVVAGGGANTVPVYYDGADWRIG